jgi:hypothetical protein
MEPLPADISVLLQERQLDVAAEKLRERAIEAIAREDYYAAISALMDLGSLEGQLAHDARCSVPILDLALAVSKKVNNPLRAQVQISRAMLLKSQGDEVGAYQAIDDALVWARQVADLQWEAHLLQHRLNLNLRHLIKRRSQQDLVSEVRNVVQAYQAAHDANGQLRTLIGCAGQIALSNPSEAAKLLDEAEVLLDTVDSRLLERMPEEVFASLVIPTNELRITRTPQTEDVKDQWRAKLGQARAMIAAKLAFKKS